MISTPIQIRFSDCDMLKHVNNAIYLQYFETARIKFFNQELPKWDWTKKGIILLKNIVEYKIPLFLTDVCAVEIECSHIGTKSFTLTYKVKVTKDKNVITKTIGESILVCYDFSQEETINLPTELRNALQKHKI
jgi:acyl-CoA thioester hydrolase